MHTWHAERGPLLLWAHPGSEVVGFEVEQLQVKHVAADLRLIQNINEKVYF